MLKKRSTTPTKDKFSPSKNSNKSPPDPNRGHKLSTSSLGSTSGVIRDFAHLSPTSNPPAHWSEVTREVVLTKISPAEIPVADLHFDLSGGADNGQFPHVGTVSATPEGKGLRVRAGVPGGPAGGVGAGGSGDFRVGDVLLEVQGQKVSGYTQADVLAWIKHCLNTSQSDSAGVAGDKSEPGARHGRPVVIRTVSEGRTTFLLPF